MKKKGEFFLIDGLFSIVILTIGFLIITSNRPSQNNEISLDVILDNSVDIFSSVKINELCSSDCICSNPKLGEFCLSKMIRNKDQTLFDGIGELYSKNQKIKAGELFMNITLEEDMLRKDIFNAELKIDGKRIYLQGEDNNPTELISSKKIIFGVYENPELGTVTYFGPYLFEVNIWPR
jgi:hypothetical protein